MTVFKAVIEKDKCFKKPIFDLIASEGNIPERDMYNTFNMVQALLSQLIMIRQMKL